VATTDPATAHFTAIKTWETLVCDTCVSQVLIAVKCAVAGSVVATGV
jgi:hypothetical protein